MGKLGLIFVSSPILCRYQKIAVQIALCETNTELLSLFLAEDISISSFLVSTPHR
jgi:hypothetical protein